MAITDAQRHRLHQRLEETLGPDEANTLMEHLPPVGWADVATRRDLDAATALTSSELQRSMAELRGEMADLSGKLRGEMADLRGELRGEMADLRGELCGEMADLRGELRGEMADLRGELCGEMADLRAEMHRGFRTQTLALTSIMFGMLGAYTALVTALVR